MCRTRPAVWVCYDRWTAANCAGARHAASVERRGPRVPVSSTDAPVMRMATPAALHLPPSPPAAGGDLAYMAAAMSRPGSMQRSRALDVASVVATPPGDAPSWGYFHAGGDGKGAGPPLWAVDLGTNVEVRPAPPRAQPTRLPFLHPRPLLLALAGRSTRAARCAAPHNHGCSAMSC